MSKKLAPSAALSVMLMASFALLGDRSAGVSVSGHTGLAVPAQIKLPAAPVFPAMPGQH